MFHRFNRDPKTPKIVWQTWKSKNPSEIPPKLYRYSQRWKTLHPDYTYILIDDKDIRQIVSDTIPTLLDDYDNFTKHIERVDFARYALLYKYGGIYADLDTNPLKSLDVWTNKNKIILGCEPREHSRNIYGREQVICNALMISPPGNKFWMDLMIYIVKNYEHNYKPVENTGPMAITRFLESSKGEQHINKIIITDPCIFYPLNGDGKVAKECILKKVM